MREMQIKTRATVAHLLGWLKSKQTMLNADKNVEPQELALSGGGNAKGCSYPKDWQLL